MENPFVSETLTAILWSHREKGVEPCNDSVTKSIIDEFGDLGIDHDISEEDLKSWLDHLRQTKDFGKTQSTGKDWERWLGLDGPIEDASQRDIEDALPVLIRHRALELKFHEWFEAWDYEVETGKKLESDEGIEYVADVYAKLRNLHGTFEVCVNFVCDDAANRNRCSYVLETLEDFAERDDTSFTTGDVFLLVTPFAFGDQAEKVARKQLEEQPYVSVLLDGDDIIHLKKSTPQEAASYLMDKVEDRRTIQRYSRRQARQADR